MSSQGQHIAHVRECDKPTFRTPGKTTARHYADKRLTTVSTITYACCNTKPNRDAAPRRTTLAPEKCDATAILLDTAQPRMNTARKGVDTQKIIQLVFLRDATFRCIAAPTMTYFIDNKEGYGVDRRLSSLVASCHVFPAKLFGVRQSPHY